MAVTDTTHAERSGESAPRRRLPYQALYAVAAGLVVIAIVLTVLALNLDTGTGPSTAPPADVTPAPSSTPSPTPASPGEKAAADATAAYVQYVAAQNQLGRDGGAQTTEGQVSRLTTEKGTERPYVKGYAKRLRDQKVRVVAGSSIVTSQVNAIELGERHPRVDLTACLDQRNFKVTMDGKPITPPEWLRYGVVMRLVSGKWLVDRVENVTADLHPQERTSCEP